jgi:hypothetical protein
VTNVKLQTTKPNDNMEETIDIVHLRNVELVPDNLQKVLRALSENKNLKVEVDSDGEAAIRPAVIKYLQDTLCKSRVAGSYIETSLQKFEHVFVVVRTPIRGLSKTIQGIAIMTRDLETATEFDVPKTEQQYQKLLKLAQTDPRFFMDDRNFTLPADQIQLSVICAPQYGKDLLEAVHFAMKLFKYKHVVLDATILNGSFLEYRTNKLLQFYSNRGYRFFRDDVRVTSADPEFGYIVFSVEVRDKKGNLAKERSIDERFRMVIDLDALQLSGGGSDFDDDDTESDDDDDDTESESESDDDDTDDEVSTDILFEGGATVEFLETL